MRYFFLILLVSWAARAQNSNGLSEVPKEAPPPVAPQPVAPPPEAIAAAVPPKFSFGGDLRLRYQRIADGLQSERAIPRLQARFGTTVELNSELRAQLRLMTGNDAASGNVSLGDRSALPSARRTLGLDLAFVEYGPREELRLLGGRMPGPFQFGGRSQLLLDRDIALEGVAAKSFVDLEDGHRLMLNAGGFILREQFDDGGMNRDETDNMLYGAQLIYRYEAKDRVTITAGLGQFGFTAMKDVATSGGSPKTVPYPARGNSVDANLLYANNFDDQQAFLEAKTKIGPVEAGMFQEVLTNTSADALNKATATGFTLAWKPVTFTYAVQKIEKDAVVGLLTDSDFANGNTSADGTVWSLSWAVSKQLALSYSEWKNRYAIETATPTDFRRSHLDLQVSF